MSSKIYINEDFGYVEAWEALAHLTDDWICGGNVSHETVMNMRDVIAELRSELAEYVELHSKVADELGTANHKLMQIEDLSKRERGLTQRPPDAGDSAASQEVSPQSGESTPEVDPAATQRR